MAQYNLLLKDMYGSGFVPIQKELLEVNGFNSVDHVHLNKKGHKAIADILLEKIKMNMVSMESEENSE